jgi:tetratricopeptide (TPR) repeat protein
LYEQASELADEPERATLIQAAGEMELEAGRAEEAIRLLEAASEAHARAGRDRESALIAYPVGRALMQLGRLDEAATRITSALEALGGENRFDPDIGRLNVILGRVLVWAGDYERAGPVLEVALAIAEALELPDVLGEALVAKGVMYQYTGRPQEAEALYSAAVGVAERQDVGDVLGRARSNFGNLVMLWDRTGAREHTEEALALYRRRGVPYSVSTSAGNLMSLHLYAGRWEELERLSGELLDEDENRPGAEFGHYRLSVLRALRGEPAADAALDRLTGWRDSGDTEFRAMYDVAVVATWNSEGRADEALEHALRTLGPAIDTVGAASDAVRDGWPSALDAALTCTRYEDAHRIIGLLADRPPGHVPPYLRAQLDRGRALLNAAEGHHETVETDLTAAIEAFANLGYPYWHAVAQTDLAAWLIDQHRYDEAIPLLEQAIATLTPLRAAPALARAESLSQAAVSPAHVA